MKLTLRNVFIVVALIATFALLGFWIWRLYDRINTLESYSEISVIPSKPIPTEAKKTAEKVDIFGYRKATFEEASKVPVKVLASSKDSTIDSLKRSTKIKDNQIVGLSKIIFQLKDSLLSAKREVIDGHQTWSYNDQFLNLTLETDSVNEIGNFSFGYNADLRTSTYWKRNWFLGKKRTYTDIWSIDPRIKIQGLNKLTIEQEEPMFGLRFQASGLINTSTGAVGVGPAARIDFGRLSLQYQHLYFYQSDRWRPYINLNYDLLRL